MGHVRRAVAIDKFGSRTGVDHRVKSKETTEQNGSLTFPLLGGEKINPTEKPCVPSRFFGDLDAQKHFAPLSEYGTFCHEPESVKIHVGPADDRNEFLLGTEKTIL